MASSLSDCLVEFVEAVSDFISQIIADEKTLAAFLRDFIETQGYSVDSWGKDEDSSKIDELVLQFQLRPFVQLAFTQIFFHTICDDFATCYGREFQHRWVPIVGTFLRYADCLWNQNGIGNRRSDTDYWDLLESYKNSHEPFTGSLSETEMLGWILAAQTDAYLDRPFVLKSSLALRRRIMQEMTSCLPSPDPYQENIAFGNAPDTMADLYEDWGRQFRKTRMAARRPFRTVDETSDVVNRFAKRGIEGDGTIGSAIGSAKRRLLSVLTRWLE